MFISFERIDYYYQMAVLNPEERIASRSQLEILSLCSIETNKSHAIDTAQKHVTFCCQGGSIRSQPEPSFYRKPKFRQSALLQLFRTSITNKHSKISAFKLEFIWNSLQSIIEQFINSINNTKKNNRKIKIINVS